MQLTVVGLFHRRLDVHRGDALALHLPEGVEDVGHLRLDHQDHRVVPQAGVGPDDQKQVGITRHRSALVGVGAVVPGVHQVQPVAPDDAVPRQGIGGLEAGAEDQAIGRVLDAISGDHAVGFDAQHGLGDHLDIAARQRRVIIVGDQHALAADGVVRRQGLAQGRAGDLFVQMAQGDFLHHFHQPWVQGKAHHATFQRPVKGAAQQALGERKVPEQPALEGRYRPVRLGHDPRRRALEQVQVGHLRRDLRHELDGTGAGADHCHALALQGIVVVPLLRVKALALEAVQAWNLR